MFEHVSTGAIWKRIARRPRSGGSGGAGADFVEVAPCAVCGVEIDRDFDRARYQVRNGQIVCAQCDAPKQLTLLGQPAARIVESRET